MGLIGAQGSVAAQAQIERQRGAEGRTSATVKWRRPCRSNRISGIAELIWSQGSTKHIGGQASPAVSAGIGWGGRGSPYSVCFLFCSLCVARGFRTNIDTLRSSAVNTTCAGMFSTQSLLRRVRIGGEAKTTTAEPQTRRREGPGAP